MKTSAPRLDVRQGVRRFHARVTPARGGKNSGNASKDAAVMLTLAPGAYSAQLAAADGTTGVGLIAVYEIPEKQ